MIKRHSSGSNYVSVPTTHTEVEARPKNKNEWLLQITKLFSMKIPRHLFSSQGTSHSCAVDHIPSSVYGNIHLFILWYGAWKQE
jgi:hypothetical protein